MLHSNTSRRLSRSKSHHKRLCRSLATGFWQLEQTLQRVSYDAKVSNVQLAAQPKQIKRKNTTLFSTGPTSVCCCSRSSTLRHQDSCQGGGVLWGSGAGTLRWKQETLAWAAHISKSDTPPPL